jgi:hypothetical protein
MPSIISFFNRNRLAHRSIDPLINHAIVIIRRITGLIKNITFNNISHIAIQLVFLSLRLEPAAADWLRYQSANDHSARGARSPGSDVTSGFFTRLAVLA